MKLTEKALQTITENVIHRLICEGFGDEYEEELDPFEEYENDYPNGEFTPQSIDKSTLIHFCQGNDFLYIYNGFGSYRISNANSSDIQNEIVQDIKSCSFIEPTHEVDYLLHKIESEFQWSYISVFKLYGLKQEYYIIYQEDK